MHESELRATVDRARHFDPDAWETLYRRLYPQLFAYARRRLPEADCDDAVSEAFTRAMDSIGRFRWRGAGFDGWMFGILRNVVYERYRAGSATGLPVGEAGEPQSGEPEPLDLLVARAEESEVRTAFGRLEPEDQEVLELRVVGGLDAKAVGSMIGKRPGAVRMAQSRALERLGALLGEPSR